MKRLPAFVVLLPALCFAECDIDHIENCSNMEVVDLLLQSIPPDGTGTSDVLEKELIRRKAYSDVVTLLDEPGYWAPAYAGSILNELRSPEVDQVLRPFATSSPTMGAMVANMYFAKVGEAFALLHLTDNLTSYSSDTGVIGTIIAVLGEQHYYPARCRILLEFTIGRWSLKETAWNALMAMFWVEREKIPQFNSEGEAAAYLEQLTGCGNK